MAPRQTIVNSCPVRTIMIGRHVEAMIDELDTNIKLMVCVLYAYYNYTNEDITDDSLVSVAKFYVKHYKNYEDITIDQFIEKYDQIFMN